MFLSFDEQIAELREQGLFVPEDAWAREALSRYGYHPLLDGYREMFQHASSKRFKRGTALADLVSLYELDEHLRALFLEVILKVERHVKALVAYWFGSVYGESAAHYMNAAHYHSAPSRAGTVKSILHVFEKLAQDASDYRQLSRVQRQEGALPFWALVSTLTFGNVSMLYAALSPAVQGHVSQPFVGINERQLGQMLKVLTKFRNVCAHGEQLFSHKTRDDIPDLPLHERLQIPKRGAQYVMGKHDLFAAVLCLRYLLPDADYFSFQKELHASLERFLAKTPYPSETELLRQMGFPANWRRAAER